MGILLSEVFENDIDIASKRYEPVSSRRSSGYLGATAIFLTRESHA
jgi:hypothetical protein